MDTTDNILTGTEMSSADINKSDSNTEGAFARGHYLVQCLDSNGVIKWSDLIENLVTNVGKANILDTYLSGSAYTASWYLGLVDGASAPNFSSTDTASSHTGWAESTAYSNPTRPAPAFNSATGTGGGTGVAGTGSKATTATSFSINATGTIAGVFLITNNTKAGTTGVLYSAGAFTGGSKSVASGDTLNATYTAQV
jgi:hypothetical protein